jgi:hypothetical protein
MFVRHHRVRIAIALAILTAGPAAAQVSIPSYGTPVGQNFNTLATAGNSGVVPPGWAFAEAGTNANTMYTAGNGSSNAGDSYSFGAVGSSERALGTVLSGNQSLAIGGSFVNNTGGAIASLAISFVGEQWRLGTQGRADRIDFQYSLDATSLTTGTWTDVNTLDFSTPNMVAATGAIDGNAVGNYTSVSGTITGLSIANGATVWIRWNDFNAQGSDDGLAVDDLSVTGQSGLTSTQATTWGRVKSLYR